MENKEYYREETLLKEALTRQQSDAEIGMPDVEEELRKFHAKHGYKGEEENPTTGSQASPVIGRKPSQSPWRRVAAIVTTLLVVGGLSWAAAHFSGLFEPESVGEIIELEEEDTRIAQPATDLPIVAPAPAEGALVYDKAELGYILSQLTQRYNLEQPDYQQASLAHIRLHVTLPESEDINELIDVLNHFGKFHLEVRDNRIYVLSINK